MQIVQKQRIIKSVKNQKGFIPVLILLTFVILGLSVYFGYSYLKPKEVSIIPTQSPIVSNSPVASGEPTADWKTYTNLELGISFKYPPKFTQNGTGLVSGTLLGDPKVLVSFADQATVNGGTDFFDGFTLYKLTDPESGQPERFAVRERSALETSPGGIYSTDIYTDLGAGLNSVGFPVLYLEVKPHIRQYVLYYGNILLTFSVIKQSDNFFKEFDQILSTFRFLN